MRNITKAQPAGYAAYMETAHMDAASTVEQDLTLGQIVLGGVLCNGFAALDEAGVELLPEDFANPNHGATLRWLRDNREQWQPGFENLVDLHRQLDKAGLASRLGQGAAGTSDLMAAAGSVGPEVLKHRVRELVASSVDRQRRKLAADYADKRITFGEYSREIVRLDQRDSACGGLPPSPPKFADFAALMAQGFKRELPTICQIAEGRFLLYPGRLNEIHGEPSTGKTNIALCICAEIMHDGGQVLYLDPEDNAVGIGSRFLALGGRQEDLLERFHYVQSPEPQDFAGLHAWAAEHKPALVVLDGLAEALAAESKSEDVPGEILEFFRERLRPFTDAGCAVLISDHVVKNTESRGRWARGSGAKLGRYDGAVYEAKLVKAYSPEINGSVRLIVSKDRCGGVGPVGKAVVDLCFDKDPEGRPNIYFAEPDEEAKSSWMPSALMEKVSRFIEDNGPQTKGTLRGLGNSGYVDKAVTKLIEGGHLAIEKQGAAHLHKIVKPYREMNGGRAVA